MHLDSSPPFCSHFTSGALSSLCELEGDEGDKEEHKVCTTEWAQFHWACTCLEEGGAPALAKDKVQGLLAQVLGLPRPVPLLFYSVLFPCPVL